MHEIYTSQYVPCALHCQGKFTFCPPVEPNVHGRSWETNYPSLYHLMVPNWCSTSQCSCVPWRQIRRHIFVHNLDENTINVSVDHPTAGCLTFCIPNMKKKLIQPRSATWLAHVEGVDVKSTILGCFGRQSIEAICALLDNESHHRSDHMPHS